VREIRRDSGLQVQDAPQEITKFEQLGTPNLLFFGGGKTLHAYTNGSCCYYFREAGVPKIKGFGYALSR